MSTSENNETPPLTRRQLREIRNTGATPIIPTPPLEPEVAPAEPVSSSAPEQPAPAAQRNGEQPAQDDGARDGDTAATAAASTDTPTGSQPAGAYDQDYADSGAQYGTTGLTRRQVRAQEKIRTASVPVISPDLAPATPPSAAEDTAASNDLPAIFRPAAAEEPAAPAAEAPVSSTVNPDLGSDLLNGETPDISLPASFDQLIARSGAATGSVSTPNALILSEAASGGPLVAPVTATGEVMITGTFELPAGLGSVGHAPGTTDGREADAVLLDGELPAASSPTPIAASAAISTVKQPGDIIRPPAPEKGSKLVIGLIITTGGLAIAVAVALVIAFTTGVFG